MERLLLSQTQRGHKQILLASTEIHPHLKVQKRSRLDDNWHLFQSGHKTLR